MGSEVISQECLGAKGPVLGADIARTPVRGGGGRRTPKSRYWGHGVSEAGLWSTVGASVLGERSGLHLRTDPVRLSLDHIVHSVVRPSRVSELPLLQGTFGQPDEPGVFKRVSAGRDISHPFFPFRGSRLTRGACILRGRRIGEVARPGRMNLAIRWPDPETPCIK